MNSLTQILVRTLQLPVTSARPPAPHLHERIRSLCFSWDYGSKSRRVCVLARGSCDVVFGVVADLLVFKECLALSGNVRG